MSREVVYDSDSATVWYDADKKVIHHKIHKFVFGDEYKKFLTAGKDALIKNRLRKWLSDDRDSSTLRDEDMAWGMESWFPDMVKAGWKYWAIVQPEKVIAQMNMKSLVEDFGKKGVVAQFFSDDEAAQKWLDSFD